MEHTMEIPDGVSPEEMELATEVAVRRIRECLGARGPLAPRDEVIYQAPGGTIHLGPLVVIDLDSKTALIGGFVNESRIQLRVLRSELVQVADAKAIVHRILLEAHPCPYCSPGKTPPRAN